MTQSNYPPSIDFKLASMQPAEAGETSALASFSTNSKELPVAKNLLLYPGEPGQMLVKLANPNARPLRWKLEIEGDFDPSWCSWHQQEPEEIAANGKIDKYLNFQVPENFFENQLALRRDRTRLQINYEAQVSIYKETETGTSRQLIGYQVFNLCVRPGSSYLNFLPAIYREIDFMERFISIFEQAFDPTVQTIDVLWAYLDPLTAPEAMLPFLAQWVAWPIDPRWNSQQQRRLIRNAVTLYRWHGTRRGLRYYLHLYTGLPLDEDLPETEKHIAIEEVFSLGFVMGKAILGEDAMLGSGRPFHFIVRLRPAAGQSIDERLVRDVIEKEKPAFCSYELEISDY